MRARLYLDEDVAPEVARLLRASGHDAVSCHETGALGLTDEAQLQKATDEGRVLLTFNYVDFLRLAAAWWQSGRHHAGVIVSYRQYRRHEIAHLVQATAALVDAAEAESLQDVVLVLEYVRSRRP